MRRSHLTKHCWGEWQHCCSAAAPLPSSVPDLAEPGETEWQWAEPCSSLTWIRSATHPGKLSCAELRATGSVSNSCQTSPVCPMGSFLRMRRVGRGREDKRGKKVLRSHILLQKKLSDLARSAESEGSYFGLWKHPPHALKQHHVLNGLGTVGTETQTGFWGLCCLGKSDSFLKCNFMEKKKSHFENEEKLFILMTLFLFTAYHLKMPNCIFPLT